MKEKSLILKDIPKLYICNDMYINYIYTRKSKSTESQNVQFAFHCCLIVC